eukprot:snap_masked-scaffold_29-processed-gene-0.3-mRNA-1 protein AED:1.00 eAED:1.00 QI:0/0/0/0/1/1/2/0/457
MESERWFLLRYLLDLSFTLRPDYLHISYVHEQLIHRLETMDEKFNLVVFGGYLALAAVFLFKRRKQENVLSTSSECLNINEILFYSRQLKLSKVSVHEQDRLKRTKVVVVGCGGLAASMLPILAGSGVGNIYLYDDDIVSYSNLHRQTLFTLDDAENRRLKAQVCKQRLNKQNPFINIVANVLRISESNIFSVHSLKEADLVVDCSDNLDTKYLLNNYCRERNISIIIGAAQGLSGQVISIDNKNVFKGNSGCYRCLFPSKPKQLQSCADNGVLSSVPSLIGTLLAHEIVRSIIYNQEKTLDFRFLTMDIRKRNDCAACEGKERAVSILRNSCSSSLQELDLHWQKLLLNTNKEWSINATEINFGSDLLIDVRDRKSFETVTLRNALNVPFASLDTRFFSILKNHKNENKKIVLFCNKGNLSRSAVLKILQMDASFTSSIANIYSLKGGINQFQPRN